MCSFVKIWRIYNNGNDPWPSGCYLQCASGESLGAQKIMVSALNPGEGTTIFLNMCSPREPGVHQSKWRLCTPAGSYFGGNVS